MELLPHPSPPRSWSIYFVTAPLLYHGPAAGHGAAARGVEYDFIVAPGADPGRIRLAFHGGVAAAAPGNSDGSGYTNGVDFAAGNTLGVLATGGEGGARFVAFVRKFSPSGSLVYSTLLGGMQPGLAGNDMGFGIGVDAGGNA